jgi:hypothetical protein
MSRHADDSVIASVTCQHFCRMLVYWCLRVEDNACTVVLHEDWQDVYQNFSRDEGIIWNWYSEVNMSFVCAFVFLEKNVHQK